MGENLFLTTNILYNEFHIYYKWLRNAEFLQMFKDAILTTKNNNPGNNASIDAAADVVAAHFPEMDKAFAKTTKSQFAEKLEEADALRDDVMVGFRYLILGNSYDAEAPIKEAAKRIFIEIDHYGTVPSLSYEAETAAIDSIVKNMTTIAAHAADITLLGLNKWVTNLKTTNDDFKKVYDSRNKEEAADTVQALGVLRKKAAIDFKALLTKIEANENLNNGVYTNLINQLNAVMKDYALKIDLRKKEKKEKPQ